MGSGYSGTEMVRKKLKVHIIVGKRMVPGPCGMKMEPSKKKVSLTWVR